MSTSESIVARPVVEFRAANGMSVMPSQLCGIDSVAVAGPVFSRRAFRVLESPRVAFALANGAEYLLSERPSLSEVHDVGRSVRRPSAI